MHGGRPERGSLHPRNIFYKGGRHPPLKREGVVGERGVVRAPEPAVSSQRAVRLPHPSLRRRWLGHSSLCGDWTQAPPHGGQGDPRRRAHPPSPAPGVCCTAVTTRVTLGLAHATRTWQEGQWDASSEMEPGSEEGKAQEGRSELDTPLCPGFPTEASHPHGSTHGPPSPELQDPTSQLGPRH